MFSFSAAIHGAEPTGFCALAPAAAILSTMCCFHVERSECEGESKSSSCKRVLHERMDVVHGCVAGRAGRNGDGDSRIKTYRPKWKSARSRAMSPSLPPFPLSSGLLYNTLHHTHSVLLIWLLSLHRSFQLPGSESAGIVRDIN